MSMTIEEHAAIKRQLQNMHNELVTLSVKLINAHPKRLYESKSATAVRGVDRLRWFIEDQFNREYPNEDYAFIDRAPKLPGDAMDS